MDDMPEAPIERVAMMEGILIERATGVPEATPTSTCAGNSSPMASSGPPPG